MGARKQRHNDHQGGETMKSSEHSSEPPRSKTEKGKRGCVEEGEELSVEKMNKEPYDPGAIGILREPGARHHRNIHPRQAGELSEEHDRSQRHCGAYPERSPATQSIASSEVLAVSRKKEPTKQLPGWREQPGRPLRV